MSWLGLFTQSSDVRLSLKLGNQAYDGVQNIQASGRLGGPVWFI